MVDPEGAQRLDGMLGCPHRLVMLENSDPFVALDVERAQVFEEVERFLSG